MSSAKPDLAVPTLMVVVAAPPEITVKTMTEPIKASVLKEWRKNDEAPAE